LEVKRALKEVEKIHSDENWVPPRQVHDYDGQKGRSKVITKGGGGPPPKKWKKARNFWWAKDETSVLGVIT